MFKEGFIGELANAKMYESQSLYTHTAGTWAGAVTVTGTRAIRLLDHHHRDQ